MNPLAHRPTSPVRRRAATKPPRREDTPAARRALRLARFFIRRAPSPRTRRTSLRAETSRAAAWKSVALSTSPSASAFLAVVRRHRHRSAATDGTTARLLATRRPTGRVPRLRVDGTVRRLPVAGTARGPGRRAMSVMRSAISVRSPITPLPSSRSSTGSMAVGVTGSSASGSRSTDGQRTGLTRRAIRAAVAGAVGPARSPQWSGGFAK